MKKKKRLWNRRKRALLWIAGLLLLFGVNLVLGLCCLTPTQAIRRYELEYMLPRGEILKELERTEGTRIFLSEYGDDLYVGRCRFYWSGANKGWRYTPLALTMRETEHAPIWGAVWKNTVGRTKENSPIDRPVFFGYVRDPDIVKVEVFLEELGNPHVWKQQIDTDDFMQTERGNRVFIAEVDAEVVHSTFTTVTGIYADGSGTEPMNTIWNYGVQ